MNGEYQRVSESRSGDENYPDLDDFPSRRYVEQVFEAERGETSFSHRFPVEISVPTYRVNDLDDVTVSVDYFDYELPDQNQIRLSSIIAIQGINELAESTEQIEDEVGEQNQVLAEDVEETFRFDWKNQYEEEREEETDAPVEYTQTREEHEEEVAIEEESNDPPSSIVHSPEQEGSEKPEGEKIDYLSNMFRETEENYTKMRLCIVQDNDTIETIAERYQVNPLVISKQNNLEDEEVDEGQLLYIPVQHQK